GSTAALSPVGDRRHDPTTCAATTPVCPASSQACLASRSPPLVRAERLRDRRRCPHNAASRNTSTAYAALLEVVPGVPLQVAIYRPPAPLTAAPRPLRPPPPDASAALTAPALLPGPPSA